MKRTVKIHAKEILSYHWEMELDMDANNHDLIEQVLDNLERCPDYWGDSEVEDFEIKSIDDVEIDYSEVNVE